MTLENCSIRNGFKMVTSSSACTLLLPLATCQVVRKKKFQDFVDKTVLPEFCIFLEIFRK